LVTFRNNAAHLIIAFLDEPLDLHVAFRRDTGYLLVTLVT